jgi:hypothetical protein
MRKSATGFFATSSTGLSRLTSSFYPFVLVFLFGGSVRGIINGGFFCVILTKKTLDGVTGSECEQKDY